MKVSSKAEVEHPYPSARHNPSIIIGKGTELKAGRDIPDYTGRPEALKRHKTFILGGGIAQ